MDKHLQQELDDLLTRYPQLKDRAVSFSKEHPAITPVIPQDGETPLCKQKDQGVEELPGLSNKVVVRRSPLHGYGVFAKETIAPGELIEESRLLKLENRSKYNTDAAMKDYVWADKSCGCIECAVHGPFVYIPLGYGSQYNHADQPNTTQKLNFRTEVFSIWAKDAIQPGEEVFVTYGDRYFMVRNFWKEMQKSDKFEAAIKAKNQRKEQAGK